MKVIYLIDKIDICDILIEKGEGKVISFKRMWDDVGGLLKNSISIGSIEVQDEFDVLYALDDDGEYRFITKEDFIDFWCRMLYYSKVSKEQIIREDKINLKYVYEIIKRLPYIKEEAGSLVLLEE